MAKLKVEYGNQLYLATDGINIIQDSTPMNWVFEDSVQNSVIDPIVYAGFVRIIDRSTNRCLQPETTPPVEAGKRRVLLAPFQHGNQSQFWKFEAVPQHQGWFFIVNQLMENNVKERCLDVCCKNIDPKTAVITYHKKQVGSRTIGNQWWTVLP